MHIKQITQFKQFRPLALSAALLLTSATVFAQGYPQQQQNYPQQQQQGYPQQQQQGDYRGPQGPGGWDQAPQEYRNDSQRQGFRDGIGAARSDFEQRLQPNVGNRPEYRHPPVNRRARNDYRAGFQRGYDTAIGHLRDRREERREDRRDDRRDDHHDDHHPQ